jgi:hypothetical protein
MIAISHSEIRSLETSKGNWMWAARASCTCTFHSQHWHHASSKVSPSRVPTPKATGCFPAQAGHRRGQRSGTLVWGSELAPCIQRGVPPLHIHAREHLLSDRRTVSASASSEALHKTHLVYHHVDDSAERWQCLQYAVHCVQTNGYCDDT